MIRNLIVRHGTEGSRHDPYGYEELSFETRRRSDQPWESMRAHVGLAEFFFFRGRRFDRSSLDSEWFWKSFETIVGVTLDLLVQLHYTRRFVCLTCGTSKFVDSVDGYPGETLFICGRCDNIVTSDFCEAAVL
ncbi:MAG: hypothetical protein UY48_C0038G0009 [Candidatus Gottesmanbacteria bacterium GW2011_GWB1_49_7]|uniref:Uncharacterized protein n=1 Tax=Candidatus Gottesmanbacteria bacterium GW2011_GWB1_49_7 TaxID=1618448 RepID=A0A0G1YVL9_9BACT|nr:MAG: hypothetical protein UY48_C0038G0009 [Candidatus Gottesmanbacteria bacterium GW2011_GWB1_49_7]